MKTIKLNLYSFNELNEQAQNKVKRFPKTFKNFIY